MAEESADGEGKTYAFDDPACAAALGEDTCHNCEVALPGLMITGIGIYAQFLGMWFALIRSVFDPPVPSLSSMSSDELIISYSSWACGLLS
jgi:hypothetical protein